MEPLAHLALIWAAVFAAVVMAKKTRMTPVLCFLFMVCARGPNHHTAGGLAMVVVGPGAWDLFFRK